jgi:hypothetical protein
MLAYKFLASGGVSPVSGMAWPPPSAAAPGAWVEVSGPLGVCSCGVHVCRAADLAHWLNDELWELEASGDELPGVDCLVVRKARLLRRIDAWSDGGAGRFTAASIAHAAEIVSGSADAALHGLIDDAKLASAAGYFAVSAYAAALAVARHLRPTDMDPEYRTERLWQAAWIERELLTG